MNEQVWLLLRPVKVLNFILCLIIYIFLNREIIQSIRFSLNFKPFTPAAANEILHVQQKPTFNSYILLSLSKRTPKWISQKDQNQMFRNFASKFSAGFENFFDSIVELKDALQIAILASAEPFQPKIVHQGQVRTSKHRRG